MSRAATPADVLSGAARWCVVEGDALDVVRALPASCIDALVTDPPSGIAFMGAEWDRDRGGRAQWVAWLASILGHARAATKDGGRALVWSLPRTSHWTGCAVEDAGWAIENTVTHLFGTGWPKGKSQLKPLAETWWLARTGRSTALNIEAVRVGTTQTVTRRNGNSGGTTYGRDERVGEWVNPPGRYPPNAVFSHAPGCRCVGEKRVLPNGQRRFCTEFAHDASAQGYGGGRVDEFITTTNPGIGDDGTELVEAWECVEGCPVRELDAQSGESVSSDRGGASRFFPCFPADEAALFGYHAKPSRAERDAGVSLDAATVDRYGAMGQGPLPQQTPRAAVAQANNHPTVKSIALMRWLVRLVTRPGDVVLDPFGGSGTTGAAALAEGRRVILVEREPRYAEIARQRCEAAERGTDWRAPASQLGLFDARGVR